MGHPQEGRRLVIRRGQGRTTEHRVIAGEYTTILDALEQIRVHEDPDLLYRHSCHHGSCGTCGVEADGEPVLACTTRLVDLPETVELGPLSAFPVIGDLAVDASTLTAGYPSGASYLRDSAPLSAPDGTRGEVPAELSLFRRFENCIECGLCVTACPVTEKFMGPAALAAWNRELEKNPERGEEVLNAVSGPDGVDACVRALRCSAVCPTGVYPAKHIALLKRRLGRS